MTKEERRRGALAVFLKWYLINDLGQEGAVEFFLYNLGDDDLRRLTTLCGVNPDEIPPLVPRKKRSPTVTFTYVETAK